MAIIDSPENDPWFYMNYLGWLFQCHERTISIKKAWRTNAKAYLKIMGITTYFSFEQHARRLKQWSVPPEIT